MITWALKQSHTHNVLFILYLDKNYRDKTKDQFNWSAKPEEIKE